MLKNLGIVQACFHLPRFRSNAIAAVGRPVAAGMGHPPRDRRDASGRRDRRGLRNARTAATCGRLVPSDVPVFFGEGDDALARFTKALEQYPAEGVVPRRRRQPVHRPGADRPPGHRGRVAEPVATMRATASRDGRPAILSPVSVYAEWFRATRPAEGRTAWPATGSIASRSPAYLYCASREVPFAADAGPGRDRPRGRAVDGGHGRRLGSCPGDSLPSKPFRFQDRMQEPRKSAWAG